MDKKVVDQNISYTACTGSPKYNLINLSLIDSNKMFNVNKTYRCINVSFVRNWPLF